MARGRIYADITETVGSTPLIALRRMAAGLPARVVVKHEGFNPFNSSKDRIGVRMIDAALEAGALRPGMIVVEASSGNTGIGLAQAAIARDLRCVVVMPDTASAERRHLLCALGAQVVLTPAEQGLVGTIAAAEQLLAHLGELGWSARQTDNPANPEAHCLSTGPEIWEDTAGAVDILVAGVGTGGTITGTGRYLRQRKPDIHVVAVQPAEAPLLQGGEPAPHQQIGLLGAFVAPVLDPTVYDEVVNVTTDDAIATTRRLAREEGIFVGISSGSCTWAALQLAAREANRGKLIVVICPDSGERYLSHPVFAAQPEVTYVEAGPLLAAAPPSS